MVEIAACGEALIFVEEKSTRQCRLRNGDRFRCGSAEYQFVLAPALLRGLAPPEIALWLAVAALFVAQIILLLKLG
jgi:hypothetical protein